jgi:SSS family solute:Na+ symporter
MLGELAAVYLGVPLAWGVVGCTAFTAAYVARGGFRAVVSTNALQFALMFAAFALVLPVALARVGGFSALWHALPASHTAWDGGMGVQFVLVWYFIALQTLVEPTFYQRCYAAASPRVARNGVLISIACWAVFDFVTTFSGLAARVLLPDLADPVLSYPALGRLVLPPLANALFAVGLFATVMSTAHSYLFLAAATVGHDLVPRVRAAADQRRWTMLALVPVGAAAVALALALKSVVAIWHDVGSIVTSALLLPVALAFLPERFRFRPRPALLAMLASTALATAWIAARPPGGRYPLGLEPVFPALLAALAVWASDRVSAARRAPPPPV